MPNPLYSPASWGFAVLCFALAYRIACPPVELRAVLANVQTASYNLSAATYQAHMALATINDPNTGIPTVLSALNGKHGVRQVLQNIDVLTVQAARTSTVAYHAAQTEEADIHAMASQGIAFIQSADANVNHGVLPALTADLKDLDRSIESMTADGHALLAQSTRTFTAAGDILSAPEWATMRANLLDTSKHLDGTVTHFDAIAAAGDQAVYSFMHPSKRPWWQMVGRDIVFPILERAAGPVFGDIASRIFRPRVDVTLTGGK